MPTIGRDGLALIQQFEGCKLLPYQDSKGIWTIGIGAIRDLNDRPVTANTPAITQAQANTLLQRDTQRASSAVTRLIAVPLAPQAFDALCCFTYNVGGGALQASTLRQVINRGEEPDEEMFARWDMAGGRHIPGLRRRRLAEYRLYASAQPAMTPALAPAVLPAAAPRP
jgi:lysozyme